jgi:hypothetical protein
MVVVKVAVAVVCVCVCVCVNDTREKLACVCARWKLFSVGIFVVHGCNS